MFLCFDVANLVFCFEIKKLFAYFFMFFAKIIDFSRKNGQISRLTRPNEPKKLNN